MMVSVEYLYKGKPFAIFHTQGQRHPIIPRKDESVKLDGQFYSVEHILHKPVESKRNDVADTQRILVVMSKLDTEWAV